VSLLLDALKRAEQEKLARGTDPQKPARMAESSGFETESPRLAPISAPALELQPVEVTAPDMTAANAPSADAKAVQNAFAAKTAGTAPSGRHRMALWAGLGAIVVVVAAAGGYVWYTIQQLSPATFAARPRPRPPAAPTPPAASSEPSSAAKMEQLVALANAKPGPGMPAPMPPSAPTPPTPEATAVAPTQPADAAPRTAVVTPLAPPAGSASQKALEGMLREGQRVPADEPFSMQRSQEKPRVPAQVVSGYEALRLGDLERARREYEAAAQADPGNIDAQLGLATVEARLGQRALAASLYRKALEIDPRDPTALAGLAALGAAANGGFEGQIRADLATSDSAALHFSLGNVYATQRRWSEAQEEYFQAFRLDPANADIAFNLAVSLDHLGQGRLATEYYERALDAATRQAAQFDPAAVSRRLAELHAQARP
jgi:Tfp pilus assembly protein PilF